MSRPRGPRRAEAVASPLALLGELQPAVDALRRAKDHLTIGGPLYAAVEAVGAAVDHLAELLGHPHHFAAMDHISAPGRTSRILPARAEPAVPSMPDPEVYQVVEDDDGTFAVIWAATGRVVEWNGALQHGLTLDVADDVADLLEALDRIAAARRSVRLDG